jgi:hypothetical protein
MQRLRVDAAAARIGESSRWIAGGVIFVRSEHDRAVIDATLAAVRNAAGKVLPACLRSQLIPPYCPRTISISASAFSLTPSASRAAATTGDQARISARVANPLASQTAM